MAIFVVAAVCANFATSAANSGNADARLALRSGLAIVVVAAVIAVVPAQ